MQKPTDPTKLGYTFDNWYTDNGVFENAFVFDTMPLDGAMLYAKWNPNPNTTYCIKYYQQNIAGDDYIEFVSTYAEGTTGATVKLTGLVDRYEGFTYQLTGSVPSGTILANGSLVLKAYYDRNTYTATFINDGENYNVQTLKYGEALATVTNPEKNATAEYTYTFTSWSKEVPETMIASDMTFIAQYSRTKNKYQVTFKDYNNDVLKTEYVEYDLSAQAPNDPKRIGYTFTSWDTVFENVKTALTVIAQYQINSYTITFNSNGGSDVEEKTQDYDTTIEKPADPTKDGYDFDNWYVDNETFLIAFDFTKKMPANDTTLYAKWIANSNTKYKIEYYQQNIANDEFTLVNLHTENKTGTTDTVASVLNYENKYEGFSYTPINSITSSNINGDGSLILKVYYTRNTYEITFINEDTTHNKQTKKYGDIVTRPNDPTKAATTQYTYTFAGWDGDIPQTMPDENITRFATYTKTTNKYIVTFKDFAGTILKKQDVEYGLNAIAPIVPALTGYTFSHWDNDYTKVNKDIVVTAKYTVSQFTITFNSNGGTAVKSITEDYNDKVIAPANPTKQGYAFDGWYKNSSLTNSYEFTKIPAENTTLYAKWVKVVDIASFIADSDVKDELEDVEIVIGKEYETLSSLKESHKNAKKGYTLTNWTYKDISTGEESSVTSETAFDYETGFEILASYEANQYTLNCYLNYNDAEDIAAITVTYDSTIILPQNPTREGYTFLGWYNGNQKVEEGDLYLASDDMSLVARWEEVEVAPAISSGPNLLWLYILLSIFGGAGLTVGTYFLVKFIEKKKTV